MGEAFFLMTTKRREMVKAAACFVKLNCSAK
jgi:hypothetical protein